MKPVGPSLARPVALSVLSCVALLALPGCGDKKEASKGNFQSAIQAYMDTTPGACVALPAKEAPFSLEKDGGFFRDRLAKAAALVEAGLLSARDTEVAAVVKSEGVMRRCPQFAQYCATGPPPHVAHVAGVPVPGE